jgi:hypothetical protein
MKSPITAGLIAFVAVVITVAMTHVLYAQYTGVGNHDVTIGQAQQFIQSYQSEPGAPRAKALYFERNIYDKILAQPGCVGIRQYFARNEAKEVTLVLVGVDSNGNDMINGIIGEGAQACPPLCIPSSGRLY